MLFGNRDARLARVQAVLQHGVFEELLLHELTQFHSRHLQQLDRLLQLWRHDELLG